MGCVLWKKACAAIFYFGRSKAFPVIKQYYLFLRDNE